MKPFRFQRFQIYQSEDVFRVGTDAVLLGALSNVSTAKHALEIGCGTGIISLMIAQRNLSVTIKALDINDQAAALSIFNFKNSLFADRLSAIEANYSTWKADEEFDLIFSNPPYFEENSSQKHILARQRISLNFLQLLEKSSILLTENGILSIIIPAESVDEIVELASKFHLYLNRKINIYGIEGGTVKRSILEFSRSEQQVVEFDFCIEKAPRKYSDQYLEITKDFHVFSK